MSRLIDEGMVILISVEGQDRCFCFGAELSGLVHGGVIIVVYFDGHGWLSFCSGVGLSVLVD